MLLAVDAYADWLAQRDIPKLFTNAEPGSAAERCGAGVCRTWPDPTDLTVNGLRFVQEDSPVEIGRAIAEFVRKLRR